MKTNTDIILNKKGIETAIKEYLNKRGWKIVGKIEFLMGVRTGGTAYDEIEEPYFDGMKIPVIQK